MFFPLVLYQRNGFSRAAQRRGFICFACRLRCAAWWACSVLFYILYAVSEQGTYTGNSNRCKKHKHILCIQVFALIFKKISWCFLPFLKCWFTVEVVELIPHVEPCIFFLDQCVGQLYFSKSGLETGEGEIIHQLRIKNCDLMLMDA